MDRTNSIIGSERAHSDVCQPIEHASIPADKLKFQPTKSHSYFEWFFLSLFVNLSEFIQGEALQEKSKMKEYRSPRKRPPEAVFVQLIIHSFSSIS